MVVGIRRWLASEEARRLDDVALVNGLAARLSDVMPIGRLATTVRTMHPEVFVRSLIWTPADQTMLAEQPHDLIDSTMYLDSPIALIHAGTDRIRVRLDTDDPIEFNICRQLRDEGATDYVVYRLPLYEHVSTFASFTTWQPGGFSDQHLEALESLLEVLSLRIALTSVLNAARSLLQTYLGTEASKRVLAGNFTRGGGELIDAVVWSCDMRGFTRMVDGHDIGEVITILDRYFEVVAAPIENNRGEVLKLIGDAILAVFPLSGSSHAASDALQAAQQALEAIAELRQPGGDPLQIGIALHVGSVLYGNIGASRRLDFTVIGRAVNEVCRVEAQCKNLGVPLLLTESFVERLGDAAPVVSLGRHSLRGVSGQTELFTLATMVQ